MSPILWILVVDELLELLTKNGIRCQENAYDIAILARGKFENTLFEIVQRGLSLAKGRCCTVGLNIYLVKTTIVPFTKGRFFLDLRTLNLGGRELELSNEVNNLGLTLDFICSKNLRKCS